MGPSMLGGPWNDTPDEEESFALRDIKAGEEIVEDYTVYTGEKNPEWLDNLQKTYCRERWDFEQWVIQNSTKPVFQVEEVMAPAAQFGLADQTSIAFTLELFHICT